MASFGRYASTISALLLLASCSLIDYAYDNAPSFVVSELDDAFNLTSLQSEQLDSRLEQFFRWHRSQELQRYQDLLDEAADASADGIEAAEFIALITEVRAAWKRAVARAIDDMGDLAATLDDDQIDQFQRYYREASAKHDDYLDLTRQQRQIVRLERDLERLEGWFGDFDIFQRDKISARLQQLPDIYEPWYRYRKARHLALTAAFHQASNRELSGEELKRILIADSSAHARAFEPARMAYWQAYAAALEDISGWLNRQQRQRAVNKLRKYSGIVERLGQSG